MATRQRYSLALDDSAERLAINCELCLDLKNAQLDDEYHYAHLPLCVIDALYSISANYTSTQNTVLRFCSHVGIDVSDRPPLPANKQYTIGELLNQFERHGAEGMATNIFQNRQRTSTRNGILKADAVGQFATILAKFEANLMEDAFALRTNTLFAEDFRQIRGQSSGISLDYFFMLTGDEDRVKPDRMVIRFVENSVQHAVIVDEAADLVRAASSILQMTHPHITPRLLDNLIWRYQSGRAN